MSAMIDAIKKRRGGGMMPQMDQDHASGDGEVDLHGLIAGLSDDEKASLQQILSEDKGDQSQAIAKGGPSSEEKMKIKGSIDQENQMHAADDASEDVDSDAIGKSMLDSRDMGANPIQEPRNLGERMRMSVSNKLKAKGKI